MNPRRSEDKCNTASPTSISAETRVQFNDNVRALVIPSLDDLTLREIEATWQTDEDKASSQADVVKSIRAMRLRDAPTTTSEHCSRGLEHFRSKAINQRLQRRKERSIRAVLEEQRAQKSQHDPERLRLVSEMHTEEARIDAIVHGSIDSEFVHQMYHHKTSQKPAKSVLSLTDQVLRPSSGY